MKKTLLALILAASTFCNVNAAEPDKSNNPILDIPLPGLRKEFPVETDGKTYWKRTLKNQEKIELGDVVLSAELTYTIQPSIIIKKVQSEEEKRSYATLMMGTSQEPFIFTKAYIEGRKEFELDSFVYTVKWSNYRQTEQKLTNVISLRNRYVDLEITRTEGIFATYARLKKGEFVSRDLYFECGIHSNLPINEKLTLARSLIEIYDEKYPELKEKYEEESAQSSQRRDARLNLKTSMIETSRTEKEFWDNYRDFEYSLFSFYKLNRFHSDEKAMFQKEGFDLIKEKKYISPENMKRIEKEHPKWPGFYDRIIKTYRRVKGND